MSQGNLEHRIDKMLSAVEQAQDATRDQDAIELINRSLVRKFSCINEDGSYTPDQDQETYTSQEQAILTKFTRRYPCDGARDALLQKLQMGDTAA